MSRRFQNLDPHWITVKFITPDTKCGHCGKKFIKGERAFYYPNSRTMLCTATDCGEQASREFAGAVMDESLYRGSGGYF